MEDNNVLQKTIDALQGDLQVLTAMKAEALHNLSVWTPKIETIQQTLAFIRSQLQAKPDLQVSD